MNPEGSGLNQTIRQARGGTCAFKPVRVLEGRMVPQDPVALVKSMRPERAGISSTTSDHVDPAQPTDKLIIRNILLNLLGQGMPLLVGIVAVPVVAGGLGPDRFGLLSLAWVLTSYFTLFDLGLGRTTTRYVAEMVATGRSRQVPEVIWTSVLSQLLFGAVGACVLVGVMPALVSSLFKVPPDLREEAKLIFYVLAAGIPVSLAITSLSGALEAKQRFDLTNAVRAPLASAIYIAPVVGVLFDLGLPTVVGLIVGSRIVAALALLIMNSRIRPGLGRPRLSASMLGPLLGFGGWVTVSAIVGPVLIYAERFLLGALLSVSAVGYYSVPIDALMRLWIIPSSFATTLFPAFSQLSGREEHESMAELLGRAARLLVAALGPAVLTVIIFGGDLLRLWLGPIFAEHSTMALRIVAIGLFANSMGLLAYALVQGMGRADLTAKLHLAELGAYAIVAPVLIRTFGITGAALAWTGRVIVDATALVVVALILIGHRPQLPTMRQLAEATAAFGLPALIFFGARIMLGSRFVLGQIGLATLALGVLYAMSWLCMLDRSQQRALRSLVGLR